MFPTSLEHVLRYVNKKQMATLLKFKKYSIEWHSGKASLTRREVACLLYLMKGKTAKEMCVSNKTVEYRIAKIKEKMQCDRTELFSILYESNLMDYFRSYNYNNTQQTIENISEYTYLNDQNKRVFLRIETDDTY